MMNLALCNDCHQSVGIPCNLVCLLIKLVIVIPKILILVISIKNQNKVSLLNNYTFEFTSIK
jgi:hypothetical protein